MGYRESIDRRSAGGNAFVMERVAMFGGINTQLNQAAQANFNWGTASMPIPEGGTKSTWSCGFSLVMARTVRDVEAAWTFIKWAAGPGGIMARSEALVEQQRRQWADQGRPGQPIVFPRITTNRAAQQLVVDAFIRALPDEMQAHFALATDALNWARGCGSEMAHVGYEYFSVVDEAARRALAHETTPQGALADAKRKIQAAVDAFYASLENAR